VHHIDPQLCILYMGDRIYNACVIVLFVVVIVHQKQVI